MYPFCFFSVLPENHKLIVLHALNIHAVNKQKYVSTFEDLIFNFRFRIRKFGEISLDLMQKMFVNSFKDFKIKIPFNSFLSQKSDHNKCTILQN